MLRTTRDRRNDVSIGLRSTFGELLARPIDRIGLLAIGLSATVASLAEATILVVISLGSLRLTEADVASVDLPFGIPLDELATTLLIVVGLAALMVRFTFLALNSYVSARLAESILFRWRRRVFLAYQAASWETQTGLEEGYLQTLTQTFVNRVNAAVQQLARAITAGTSFLTFVLGAFVVSPVAALALVVFGVVVLRILRPLTNLIRKFSKTQGAAYNEYARLLGEASALVLEHRTLGADKLVATRLEVENRKMTRALRHQLIVQTLTPQLYTGFGYVAILGGLATAQQLAIDELVVLGAIILLMLRSLVHGQTFQSTIQSVAAAQPFIRELFDSVGMLEANCQKFGDLEGARPETMELRSVDLGYRGNAMITEIDLVIERGYSVGIIGPSGGGKSTLALALSGLLKPVSGEYLINGIGSDSYAASWWHQHLSFVPQQPVLFEGDIAENIAMHREVSKTEIESAARAAHLGGEIDAWPEGLGYLVGPRGGRLSGGQRQRICIARALVGNPEMLILDEPTSALDSEAEDSITDVLKELRHSCTMIVVAHRLSTLEFCDRVLLVDNGRVVEVGTGADVQNRSDLRERIVEAMAIGADSANAGGLDE